MSGKTLKPDNDQIKQQAIDEAILKNVTGGGHCYIANKCSTDVCTCEAGNKCENDFCYFLYCYNFD